MSDDYDPGEYTVDEVKSYVEDHLTEAQSIREAEAAGKNRSTLITWLDDQMGGTQEPPEEPGDQPTGTEPNVEPEAPQEEPVPEQQDRTEFRSP